MASNMENMINTKSRSLLFHDNMMRFFIKTTLVLKTVILKDCFHSIFNFDRLTSDLMMSLHEILHLEIECDSWAYEIGIFFIQTLAKN